MERNGGLVEGAERVFYCTLVLVWLRDWCFAQDGDVHEVLWPWNPLGAELWQRRGSFQRGCAAGAVRSGSLPERKHGHLERVWVEEQVENVARLLLQISLLKAFSNTRLRRGRIKLRDTSNMATDLGV